MWFKEVVDQKSIFDVFEKTVLPGFEKYRLGCSSCRDQNFKGNVLTNVTFLNRVGWC